MTNTNSIFERVENARKLWELLVPSFPVPDDPQLARWLHSFTESELEHAFSRTAVKGRRGLLADAIAAYRYASGVLVNERRDNEVNRAV